MNLITMLKNNFRKTGMIKLESIIGGKINFKYYVPLRKEYIIQDLKEECYKVNSIIQTEYYIHKSDKTQKKVKINRVIDKNSGYNNSASSAIPNDFIYKSNKKTAVIHKSFDFNDLVNVEDDVLYKVMKDYMETTKPLRKKLLVDKIGSLANKLNAEF